MTSVHLILGIFSLLLGFGLLMVLSASSIASIRNGHSAFAAFESQAFFAAIGFGGFLFASRTSTRMLRSLAFPAVAISLALLAAVLVTRPINGARSWITLGPKSFGIVFQPSEVAKLALLLWMAQVLAARRYALGSLRALLFPVVPIFVLMVALIMLEPDLGTTVSLGLVFMAVLWFGGAPWWIFAGMAGLGGAAVTALALLAPYRFARVNAWLHPDTAPASDTFQVFQGWYSMGHGGIFGAGLGQSIGKWGRLPNADSDFIFAIVGEELGLVGAGMLVLLFCLLAYTGLRIARRNVDPFIKIVAASATVWLVGQAVINIGYVVGLLPVTGIPLPMISRGGTSLVITMTVFGLLANFARREPHAAAALLSDGPSRLARFLGLGRRMPKPPKVRKPRERRTPPPQQVRPQQVRSGRSLRQGVPAAGGREDQRRRGHGLPAADRDPGSGRPGGPALRSGRSAGSDPRSGRSPGR